MSTQMTDEKKIDEDTVKEIDKLIKYLDGKLFPDREGPMLYSIMHEGRQQDMARGFTLFGGEFVSDFIKITLPAIKENHRILASEKAQMIYAQSVQLFWRLYKTTVDYNYQNYDERAVCNLLFEKCVETVKAIEKLAIEQVSRNMNDLLKKEKNLRKKLKGELGKQYKQLGEQHEQLLDVYKSLEGLIKVLEKSHDTKIVNELKEVLEQLKLIRASSAVEAFIGDSRFKEDRYKKFFAAKFSEDMKKGIDAMEKARVFILEFGIKFKETKKETATVSKTEEEIQKRIKAFIQAVENVEKRGVQFKFDSKTIAALEDIRNTIPAQPDKTPKPSTLTRFEDEKKERLAAKTDKPVDKEDKGIKPT